MLPLRPDAETAYVVNGDGTGLRKLFDDPAYDYFDAIPSPDGTKLAVAARASGVSAGSQLLVISVGTGEKTPVVNTPDALLLGSAAWAPGASRLAYTLADAHGGLHVHLYTLGPGTDVVLPIAAQQIIGWSPDGTRLFAYIAYSQDRTAGIYAIDLASLAATQLLAGDVQAAVLSPDRRSIAYALAIGGLYVNSTPYSVGIVDAAGTGVRREVTSLPETDYGLYGLAWSPDGLQIAYGWAVEDDSARGIYVVDVAGGARRQVTHSNAQFDVEPAWSPDGRWLLAQRLGCVRCDGGGGPTVVAAADGSSTVVLDRGALLGTSALWLPGHDARFLYSAEALSVADASAPADLTQLASMPASQYQSLASVGGRIFFTRSVAMFLDFIDAAHADGVGLHVLGRADAVSPDGRATARGLAFDIGHGGAITVQRDGATRVFPASMFADSVEVSTLAWAPDSRRLLVLSAGTSHRLVVLDTITGKLVSTVTLPDPPPLPNGQPPAVLFDAVWSPNGTRVAYSAPSGVWLVSAADNGTARHLVDAEPAQLAWSPDGTQIAIAESARLRVIAADRSGAESHAFAVTTVATPPGAGLTARSLAWSPDGQRIALAVSAGIETLDLREGTTQTTAALQVGGLVWSPDGTRIAYAGICDGDPNSVHRGICIIGRGGGPVLTLVEGTGRDYRPLQWRSDGTIFFASLGTGI